MIALLVKWVVYAAALMVGANVIKSVHLRGWGAAFGAAAAFGVVNVLLGWLLGGLITLLSLPVTILTLGLFLLVIPILVNMILLKLADAMTGEAFEVEDAGGLFGLALLMSVAGFVAGRILT